MVAPIFRAFEAGGHLGPVAVGERGLHDLQLILKLAQRAEDFLAVLLENGTPDLRVAGGDAGGVAQAAACIVAPRRIFGGEKPAEHGREHLWQVADVRDDLVVRIGRNGDGLRPERMPELYHGLGRGGVRAGQRRDKAGS